MKNLRLLSMALLIADGLFCQTEFAPVGAKWWVEAHVDFPFTIYLNEYECTGVLDTLGHLCKVVHENSFDGPERDWLFYQDGQQVYYYMEQESEFALLFDYSIQGPGQYETSSLEGPVTIFVDSTTVETFSGEAVKVQHARPYNIDVPFSQPYNYIYEGIGTHNGIFLNLPNPVVVQLWYYLACYQRPDGKLFTMNPDLDVDCQALASAVEWSPHRRGKATIHPNPATDQATISLPAPLPQPATWHLFDALGQEVARAVLSAGQQEAQVGLSGVPSGLYFWQVGNGEGTLGTGKLIIAK